MANNIQIADLELQITSNSTSAVDGISRLIAKLGELKQITSEGVGLNKLGRQFKNFDKKIQALDLSKIENLKSVLQTIGEFNGTTTIAAPKVDSELASGEIANNINETDSAMQNLVQDEKDMAKAASAANKPIRDTKKEIKDTGKEAKKTSSKIGSFIKSIARIALYRAIRSMLKGIVSAFKTGAQNLYQFDKSIDGTFSKSMDTISSAAQNIKNSLAVIVAPLVESLAPAIERISDLFLQFSESVSKVSAQINGKTTYTKAIKSTKEYQEALDKAKSSAQGFDELNIIDTGTDVSSMFEEVELGELTESEQSIANLFKIIKEIVDLIKTDIMPFLKDVLGKILPQIAPILTAVGQIIKEIISAISKVLNSDELLSLNETITKVVNSVLKMVKEALPTIKKILEIIGKVVQKISGFIDKIVNDGIGKAENSTGTLLVLINGILDIVNIVLDLLDPILNVIAEIVKIITSLVDSILVAIKPILEGIFDILTPILQLVIDVVVSAIKPLVPILQLICGLIEDVLAPILEKVGVFVKPLLELIGTALQGILGWVSGIAEFLNNGITDALKGIVLLWKAFFSLFSGDVDKMKDTWGALGDHMKNTWQRLWDGVKNIFVKIINGIITGFEKFVNGLIIAINWLTDKLSNVWTWTGIPAIPQIQEVSFNRISAYAQGGYDIPRGQLFVANEAGAEMVGSMDGKTAVANNQQIIEGIRQGVYDAILAASSSERGDNRNINLALYLDGRQIKAEMDRLSQSKGASIATGGLVYYG